MISSTLTLNRRACMALLASVAALVRLRARTLQQSTTRPKGRSRQRLTPGWYDDNDETRNSLIGTLRTAASC